MRMIGIDPRQLFFGRSCNGTGRQFGESQIQRRLLLFAR
jgi:hypothetical protein